MSTAPKFDYQLYAIRIFSYEWDDTTAFYRDTIGLDEKFSNAEMGWAEFDLGGASLAVERADPEDTEHADLVGRFVGASLAVDAIEEVYTELSGRGVKFHGPPARQAWGGILAHFDDPDGNVITLLGS